MITKPTPHKENVTDDIICIRILCIARNVVMPKIKLKEWADKHGLSYITANRHFHAGLIPNAQQLDSGTILIEDESLEQNMAASGTNDAMSLFLKKTVEFSKNNASVEDFAAYVISNFQLKLNGQIDVPRYSKNRPKPEEVQKHFQQFLPDKEKAEQLKAIKSLIKEQVKGKEILPNQDLSERFSEEPNPFTRVVDATNGMDAEWASMGADLLAYAPQTSSVRMYDSEETTDGLVTRSVDLNTTPQQISYTGSTSQAISSSSSLSPTVVTNSVMSHTPVSGDLGGFFGAPTVSSLYFNAQPASAPFQPTQKELLSSAQVIETAEAEDMPRKRGRKPTFKKR